MKRGTAYDIKDILPNMLLVLRKTSSEEYDKAIRVMEEHKRKQDGNGEVTPNDDGG